MSEVIRLRSANWNGSRQIEHLVSFVSVDTAVRWSKREMSGCWRRRCSSCSGATIWFWTMISGRCGSATFGGDLNFVIHFVISLELPTCMKQPVAVGCLYQGQTLTELHCNIDMSSLGNEVSPARSNCDKTGLSRHSNPLVIASDSKICVSCERWQKYSLRRPNHLSGIIINNIFAHRPWATVGETMTLCRILKGSAAG